MRNTLIGMALALPVGLVGCSGTNEYSDQSNKAIEEKNRHVEEMDRFERGYQEQRADLNRSGVDEIFYVESYARASSLISNLDGEPGTFDTDWAIAYQEALGRNFDTRISNPTRLLISDLQLVIEYYSPKN